MKTDAGPGLPCVVCRKDLTRVFPGDDEVHDGVNLCSLGSYGSRVWDPMDDSLIVMNICDDCLVAAQAHVGYRPPRRIPDPPPAVPWDPAAHCPFKTVSPPGADARDTRPQP